MKLTELKPEFVEYMDKELEPGILYISLRFRLAIHLCACGDCGIKTVTPLDRPTGWDYTCEDGLVTLHPSIGNQQFPCKSHYWIERNQVRWC